MTTYTVLLTVNDETSVLASSCDFYEAARLAAYYDATGIVDAISDELAEKLGYIS